MLTWPDGWMQRTRASVPLLEPAVLRSCGAVRGDCYWTLDAGGAGGESGTYGRRAFLLTGPVPLRSGVSQRGLRCVSHRRRSLASIGSGSGTRRSLSPLPMTRSTPLVFSISRDLNLGLPRQCAGHRRTSVESRSLTGSDCAPEPEMAPTSAWESAVGRRCFLGARTLRRTAANRDRASSNKGSGLPRDWS